MSRPDPPVPQEAVDALQRGDLVAAFKSLRQAGGINMQAVGARLKRRRGCKPDNTPISTAIR